MPLARRAGAITRRACLRVVCGGAVLVHATGCMTWRSVPATDLPDGDVSYPRARLVLTDGKELFLRDVVVRADSVIGHVDADTARVAVERSRVTTVQARRVSAVRTIGVALGVVAVVALVALISVVRAFNEGFTAAPSPAPSAP